MSVAYRNPATVENFLLGYNYLDENGTNNPHAQMPVEYCEDIAERQNTILTIQQKDAQ